MQPQLLEPPGLLPRPLPGGFVPKPRINPDAPLVSRREQHFVVVDERDRRDLTAVDLDFVLARAVDHVAQPADLVPPGGDVKRGASKLAVSHARILQEEGSDFVSVGV